MKYLSQIFQPLLTIPKNAKIKNIEITCKSQKLLLECGLVRPTSSGLFTLLPLARRALDKLERIIRKHVEEAGAQPISFPTLTASNLWERTGRLQSVGSELLKLEDRHGKSYLLAPTYEEAVADLLKDVGPISYKQLPLFLYQIGSKYRDELRPKHGLMRARQFSMLDVYGAHGDMRCARSCYQTFTDVYTRIFDHLQLTVHRVTAPSGEMGGSLSHEWQLPAESGEDRLSICPSCSHATLTEGGGELCEKCGKEMDRVNSIEVGHTFILGKRYSEPLQANYVVSSGGHAPVIMSCYGLGLTRLLAATLDSLSSEAALRWPMAIAPYTAVVIGPKEGSKEWLAHGEDAGAAVGRAVSAALGVGEVVLDDRHSLTVGKRLMQADRLGYPYIVVCGRSTLESPPKFELYRSLPHQQSTHQVMTLEELVATLSQTAGKQIMIE